MAKNKKNAPSKPSLHHITPTSRGGPTIEDNLAPLRRKEHQDYHTLFGNMTPVEIIDTLATHYWNGHWEYVEKAYRGRNDRR